MTAGPEPTARAAVAFTTVTNSNYFCGTVATVNSVRRFYPDAPIYVFPEVRWPLTESQRLWLSRVPRLSCLDAEDLPGRIKEAWQQKAHGAHHLTDRPISSHLVLVDSDLVLAAPIGEMIRLVETYHVPCGGKDGDGVSYGSDYWPYIQLCQSNLPRSDHFNPHYMSTSLCVLPCDRQHQTICQRWSQAVDRAATFGPDTRDHRTYEGYSDQGLLNAILFFSQVTPVLMDNETVSEHWIHGQSLVTRAGDAFFKRDKRMIAFHSVGHAPKFWQAEYRGFVSDAQPNLDAVYDYWLDLLFAGPVGLLRMFDMPWLMASDLFAEHGHLLETYRDHLQAR